VLSQPKLDHAIIENNYFKHRNCGENIVKIAGWTLHGETSTTKLQAGILPARGIRR
jgi:hypothetical protein